MVARCEGRAWHHKVQNPYGVLLPYLQASGLQCLTVPLDTSVIACHLSVSCSSLIGLILAPLHILEPSAQIALR